MRVLFICRGNVERSQEAEAFYNQFTGTQGATSAGIEAIPGKPIAPYVVQAMSEVGIDLSTAFRKPLSQAALEDSDVIISFVPVAELPAVTGRLLEYWDVPDTRGTDLDNHRVSRDHIKQLVEEFIARSNR